MSDRIPAEAFLADYPAPMRDMAERLRGVVRRAVPDAIEGVRPGWRLIGYDLPLGRRTAFFTWVWPELEHVHLGFPNGVLMDDPDGRLQGSGVTVKARWLTLRPSDPIDEPALAEFVREAGRVAAMSKSERFARLLDRDG
ncbi:MAG TPA: DUF1801 domain-containing protein [Candidatus Limnocylindrales bacterium]